MFSKILVCTDGSSNARKAVENAALLAQCTDASILLLHVTGASSGTASFSVPWQIERTTAVQEYDVLETQQRILDDAESVFRQAGRGCRCLLEDGHPAREILRVAHDEKVDLIILGDRGTSHLDSLQLGSVTAEVALHAPCSVWIVR